MNAKEARAATEKAISKRRQEVSDAAKREEERRIKEDEYTRSKTFPDFMDKIRKMIQEATASCKTSLVASTTNRMVAQLALAELLQEGYECRIQEIFVPEETRYGDSGEGMHDSYWDYYIHIKWSKV